MLAGCTDPDLQAAIDVGNRYMAAVGSADLDAALECYDDSGPHGDENAARHRATLADRLDAWAEMESFGLTTVNRNDMPFGTVTVLGYECEMKDGSTRPFVLRLVKWKGSTEHRVVDPLFRRGSVTSL